jgi:uncharacterized membrane-anchored protein
LALWVQLRTRRYNAFAYWATVMMVAVCGTMAADVMHHQLGVSFGMCTLFCALAVAVHFIGESGGSAASTRRSMNAALSAVDSTP